MFFSDFRFSVGIVLVRSQCENYSDAVQAGKEKQRTFRSWTALRKHVRKILAAAHPTGGCCGSEAGGEEEEKEDVGATNRPKVLIP